MRTRISWSNWAKRSRTLIFGLICVLAFAAYAFPAAAQPRTQTDPPLTPEPEGDPGILIVGGVEAQPGAWPWMASLRSNGSHICGASLIAPDWVVTAAHCAGGSASSYSVVLGDHNRSTSEGTEQTIRVASVTRHPNYNSSTTNNDIALMRLSQPATLNSRVQTVRLVVSPTDDPLFAPGQMSTVTGWGATSEGGSGSQRLMQVSVPIVSNTTCNSSVAYGGRITDAMLCAGYAQGGKDSCQGDSGGPLVVGDGAGGWKLAGLVSWGDGCARPNKYGVYTRVAKFTSWVLGIIGPTPTRTPTPGTTTPTPVTRTPTPITTTPGPGTVFSDDFETDKGWTRNPNGSDTATSGQWERGDPEATDYNGPKQLGTTTSGSNDLVTGRLAGSGVGAYDLDGGTTSIRSPSIALPSSGNLTLSFRYSLAHASNATSADYLRVKIVGSTTTTVFEKLGAASDVDASWQTATVNLSSYAGQTIRILIEAGDVSTASLLEAAVDDVRVNSQ